MTAETPEGFDVIPASIWNATQFAGTDAQRVTLSGLFDIDIVNFHYNCRFVSAKLIPPSPNYYARNSAFSFSPGTGKVLITYTNGVTVSIDITVNMCSGYNMSRTGRQEITVTFKDRYGATHWLTYWIEVVETISPEPEPDAVPPALNTADHFAYIIGYSDGTIRPLDTISREEVATIIFRLLTGESRSYWLSRTNAFSDVAGGHWSNTAISTLTNAGILSGYLNGTFDPSGELTRAELVTILAHFTDITDAPDAGFTDIGGHWAGRYINIAASLGWINGYSDGTFRPDAPVTRAEAMAIINRVLGRHVSSPDDLLPGMAMWSDNADPLKWYYLDIQLATNSYTCTTDEAGLETWTGLLENPDWSTIES